MTAGASAHARLYLWRGCSLVVGPGIDSKLHSHFATQLTVALDQPFRARFSEDTAWTETRAAIFAPNQEHQIDSNGLLAHLFVELPQRAATDTSALVAPYATMPQFDTIHVALQQAYSDAADLEVGEHAARTWLDCALPASRADVAFDPRIAQALELIAAEDQQNWTGDELATRVHLSTSRFTHLFRKQTGLPLTRYLLWNRLLAAVEAVAQGANTTAAAHLAGFADLAHMSRTFRNTFGVMPSELQKMTIAFKRDQNLTANMKP